MRRQLSKGLAFGLFLAGLVGASLCAGPGYAFGQDRPGRLNVTVRIADNSLKGRPVMVSAIGDGKVVTQYEVVLVEPPGDAHTILDSLPAGQYDVRVEGDGLVTEVKRGVQVFSGRDGSLILNRRDDATGLTRVSQRRASVTYKQNRRGDRGPAERDMEYRRTLRNSI